MQARSKIRHSLVNSESSSAVRELHFDKVTTAHWATFIGFLSVAIVLLVLWTKVQLAVGKFGSSGSRVYEPHASATVVKTDQAVSQL